MVVDLLLFVVGAVIVIVIMLSAIRTVVLPTGGRVRLTRSVFRAGRALSRAYARLDRSPGRRAGDPPDVIDMMIRLHGIGSLDGATYG